MGKHRRYLLLFASKFQIPKNIVNSVQTSLIFGLCMDECEDIFSTLNPKTVVDYCKPNRYEKHTNLVFLFLTETVVWRCSKK